MPDAAGGESNHRVVNPDAVIHRALPDEYRSPPQRPRILPGLLRDVFPCQMTKSDFALSEEEAAVDNVESFWMPREIGDLLAHHLGG